MRIDVDISGQITQRNLDSSLGFRRSDGLDGAVVLTSRTKKEILGKYKGQVTNLVEKIHCILIYYAIKDHLSGVEEIHVCRDVKFRALKQLLPRLFSGLDGFGGVKITARKAEDDKSLAHWSALKTYRKRGRAKQIIKKKQLEEKLFEFKI